MVRVMAEYYILEGRTVVPVDNVEEWARRGRPCVVAQENVGNRRVSTVFLGMDHSFNGSHALFETMIFPQDSWREEYCERCSTYEEAEAMHAKAVASMHAKAVASLGPRDMSEEIQEAAAYYAAIAPEN